MSFDPKFKEKARAEDAIDRLRDVQARIDDEQARRTVRKDFLVRLVIAVPLALAVLYAIAQI